MKYTLKLLSAFFKRFKGILFFSTLAGLLIFFFLQSSLPMVLERASVRIGVTGRHTPDELPDFILERLSRGLTRINSDGSPEPDLATWKSDDGGRKWIFTLKENITWQDGEALVASDLNYEFSDVEVFYEDDRTITFQLKDPFSPFPSIVASPVFKKGLLGVGEWEVQKLTSNGRFVQELVLEDVDKNEIVYRFYPTEEATKNAYILGKVDIITGIVDPDPIEKWNTVVSEMIIDANQVVTLFFNTQDDFLADKSVRQALAYSIPKTEMGERALSPISSSSWAYNPQVKEYLFDTERSVEILEDIPQSVLESVNIKIVTTPTLLEKAELVASSWNNIGIETSVQVSSVVPTEFQVFMTILDIPADPDQYPLWHSTQTATNVSRYSNPRIDKLLEDGRSQLDLEDRKKTYLDFQRFLLEDVPAIFLYHPTYYNITRK